jgi:hypothetical protein
MNTGRTLLISNTIVDAIRCPDCRAFARIGFGAPSVDPDSSPIVAWAYAERDGRLTDVRVLRRQRMEKEQRTIMAERGWASKRGGRSRGRQLTKAVASLKLPHDLFPKGRRERIPNALDLLWIHNRVLEWLDHRRPVGQGHLLRVEAPSWMRQLTHLRGVERLLGVSEERWALVRRKAARIVVASVLRIKGGERAVQQKMQRVPRRAVMLVAGVGGGWFPSAPRGVG